MQLKDVDLIKLCPAFMREDKANQILASGVSNIFQEWAENLDRLIVINQIDNLLETELDQLAKDRNIFWYDFGADISVKRALIKNAKIVFNRLGTVWAVESVMNDYLPKTELQEWFDYDGEPGYFRIVTNNTAILKTDIKTFLSILEKIKRRSVWLEQIMLRLEQMLVFYPGWGIVEKSRDTFLFTSYLRKGQMEGMTKGELEGLLKGEMEG
jgi:P2-related tail formation protein